MNFHSQNVVAGIDGARGEWVIALFDGTSMAWEVATDVESILDRTGHCASVGVDMPLSMPSHGYRVSELEAKRFLGPARSSIFHTPTAAVLHAQSYEDACAISRASTGKAISKQTWFLLPGIRAWHEAHFDRERIVEVHPECSFRVMQPGTAFASKKSGRGAGQRMKGLASWIDPGNLADGLAELPAGPALDDALDAAAAAWSAWRFGRSEHRVFGTADATDRIVA